MAFFRKRDNGWEYRISYIDASGKRKIKSKSGFLTKTLAKQAALEAELKINSGEEEKKIWTLIDFFKMWSETYKKPHITEKTWRSYLSTQNYIEKYFGNIEITKITPTKYQKFLNDFSEQYAQDTIERTHFHIKSSINIAIRENILSSNFAEGAIVKSKRKKTDESESFLQENEYISLIEKTRQKPKYVSYAVIYLIAVTGMRYAEAVGLTWKDINFRKKIIDINKTWDYSISKEFAPTKNHSSVRKVPIDNNTIKFLKEYQKLHHEERLFAKTSNTGTNQTLRRLVGRKVHIHSLRHTYASFLIFKGVDLLSISKILGHDNLNITLKVYAHQLKELEEKNNDNIRDIFKNLGRI